MTELEQQIDLEAKTAWKALCESNGNPTDAELANWKTVENKVREMGARLEFPGNNVIQLLVD